MTTRRKQAILREETITTFQWRTVGISIELTPIPGYTADVGSHDTRLSCLCQATGEKILTPVALIITKAVMHLKRRATDPNDFLSYDRRAIVGCTESYEITRDHARQVVATIRHVSYDFERQKPTHSTEIQ